MPEILQKKERTARKAHICDYCGGTIEKGEIYEYTKLTSCGEIYEWKNHKKCGFIASELWDYIDPDDGMGEEDFQDGCREFCQTFVCPDCDQYNKEFRDCKKDEIYCADKIYDFLQSYELYRERREGCFEFWKCRKRKDNYSSTEVK